MTMSHYLSLLLFLPLVGALLVLCVPARNVNAVKWLANGVSLAGFLLGFSAVCYIMGSTLVTEYLAAGGAAATSCAACSAGSFCPAGSVFNTVPCPRGYYCAAGQAPAICPAGTFSAGFSQTSVLSCTPCPTGTYSNVPGASACGTPYQKQTLVLLRVGDGVACPNAGGFPTVASTCNAATSVWLDEFDSLANVYSPSASPIPGITLAGNDYQFSGTLTQCADGSCLTFGAQDDAPAHAVAALLLSGRSSRSGRRSGLAQGLVGGCGLRAQGLGGGSGLSAQGLVGRSRLRAQGLGGGGGLSAQGLGGLLLQRLQARVALAFEALDLSHEFGLRQRLDGGAPRGEARRQTRVQQAQHRAAAHGAAALALSGRGGPLVEAREQARLLHAAKSAHNHAVALRRLGHGRAPARQARREAGQARA